MSALDSLGKSIGEVIDERMSSPLLSSFTIAWVIINYKFFVILFSDTTVSQTFSLIHDICFPDGWALASRGFLYPLGAALFYLFALPKPSQFVYEHWRKLQKWKNDINYKYDSEAYETLPKSRAQRDRITELVIENRNLNAEIEQMRTDAKDRIAELNELKSRSVSEEIDGLKELLHTATQEREEYKLEMQRNKDELQKTIESRSFEISDMEGAVDVAKSEQEKLRRLLNEALNERKNLQETVQEMQMAVRTSLANEAKLAAEHREALDQLQQLHSSKSKEVEAESSVHRSPDPVIKELVKENLVAPSFDVAHLLVLNEVAHNRDVKAERLYSLIELPPVHIDYCLVELIEQGLIQANASEYEENGYELTQRGRRAYVRANSLEASR